MSYVDLATLTLHRRHELECRTHIFDEKCDRAINDIKNLKSKAKGFVSQLNCDPSELKERFLSVMQKLDEYIYLITDFNLAMAQTADSDSAESAPVQDAPTITPSLSPFNIMDVLSEPLRPTSCAPPPPTCPAPPLSQNRQNRLIDFSSSSSAESVPVTSEKEIQCTFRDIDNMKIKEPMRPVAPTTPIAEYNQKECCITAAQTILEVDQMYTASIICVNSCYSFWVITEEPEKVTKFMIEMTQYYLKNPKVVSPSEIENMTYCAYRDDGVVYRAMILQKPEGDDKTVIVYVIDTGEERTTTVDLIQPLVKQFCDQPPFARLCHLAGLDFGEHLNDKALMKSQDEFMKNYTGTRCTIYVDDNSSESLGVYLRLPYMNITLNQMMVNRGLAIPIDKPDQMLKEQSLPEAQHMEVRAPPPATSEEEVSLANLDITQCPEHEDPVVAVTGYHNRDEADICKYYRGPPEKTCFKGPRCTKKHILHHPDGWTLDQVEVTGLPSLDLPAPGAWFKVLVTTVCHFDRLFVQIQPDFEQEDDEVPEFGVVLPPMTLTALHRDMNSPATRQAYKPLTLAPALGEIVAALYPPDNCWYRAKVLTVTRFDQSIEIMYVDYGTVLWVKEDQIRVLEPRLAALPPQAVQCALAGVRAPPAAPAAASAAWARAKRALAALAQDRRLHARLVAREYDELIVELYTYKDEGETIRGQNVAEILAQQGLVKLEEYSVADEIVTQKLVVP